MLSRGDSARRSKDGDQFMLFSCCCSGMPALRAGREQAAWWQGAPCLQKQPPGELRAEVGKAGRAPWGVASPLPG